MVLRFSALLDAATATDVHNYQLFQALLRGHRAAIPIRSAAYDPASRTVTLTPARPLYLFGRDELVVNGTSPTGVSDVFGNLLDGAGTGLPGSDYVRVFGQEVLVGQSPPVGPRGRAAAWRGITLGLGGRRRSQAYLVTAIDWRNCRRLKAKKARPMAETDRNCGQTVSSPALGR